MSPTMSSMELCWFLIFSSSIQLTSDVPFYTTLLPYFQLPSTVYEVLGHHSQQPVLPGQLLHIALPLTLGNLPIIDPIFPQDSQLHTNQILFIETFLGLTTILLLLMIIFGLAIFTIARQKIGVL